MLLLAPARVLRLCGGRQSGAVRLAARVLGARQLTETLVRRRFRSPAVARLLRGVDLIHAASMAGLAVVRPAYARPALVSVAVSSMLTAADGRRRPDAGNRHGCSR